MNQKFLEMMKKEAANYQDEMDAFIHVEMKSGTAELILSGDIMGMLDCVNGVIKRVSTMTGMPYKETLECMVMINRIGLRQAEKLAGKGLPGKRRIEGEDWQKDWKEQTRKEAEKKASVPTAMMTVMNAALKAENESLKSQLSMARKQKEDLRAEKNKEIDRQNKEILRLEHRIKEISEELQCGGNNGTDKEG